MVAFERLEHVPNCVARRRACPRVPASPKMYPSRTRDQSKSRHHGQHNIPICRVLDKPSSGLEPETPSLPWRFGSVTRVHARSLTTQLSCKPARSGASRCVARVVSDVSVLCPRSVFQRGNGRVGASGPGGHWCSLVVCVRFVSAGRRLICQLGARQPRFLLASRRLRATILQTFPIYENIAKIPIQGRMAAIADLMTSDSRVGPAIGLTWLPRVSHQAVYDALLALTGAGLVRRIPTVRFRRWRHA